MILALVGGRSKDNDGTVVRERTDTAGGDGVERLQGGRCFEPESACLKLGIDARARYRLAHS
jgi:hypothetical protein